MPHLQGLLETAIFVENLDRARDFYGQILGLKTLQDSAEACVFTVAKAQLLLLITQEKASIPSRTPGGDVPPCRVRPDETTGAGHLAFAIAEAEFEEWRTYLANRGVEVLSEVRWAQGARSLYFRDPDGHLLELATPGLWGLRW